MHGMLVHGTLLDFQAPSMLPSATLGADGALQDIKVGSRLAPNAHECLAPRRWPQQLRVGSRLGPGLAAWHMVACQSTEMARPVLCTLIIASSGGGGGEAVQPAPGCAIAWLVSHTHCLWRLGSRFHVTGGRSGMLVCHFHQAAPPCAGAAAGASQSATCGRAC